MKGFMINCCWHKANTKVPIMLYGRHSQKNIGNVKNLLEFLIKNNFQQDRVNKVIKKKVENLL